MAWSLTANAGFPAGHDEDRDLADRGSTGHSRLGGGRGAAGCDSHFRERRDELGFEPWTIHGDHRLVLAEAARVLRWGIELRVGDPHPLSEYHMLGLARLLDALAFSLQTGDEVHHVVVSRAVEMARHVTTYLLPMLQASAPRPRPREQLDGDRTVTGSGAMPTVEHVSS